MPIARFFTGTELRHRHHTEARGDYPILASDGVDLVPFNRD